MADLITSSANPVVKRVRLLAERRHRRREGAFVVQGIQPVWQAVEAGADIETLIVAPGLLGRSPAARRAAGMVAGQEAAGVRVARVSDELFGRLSDREGPPGLAAIVRGQVGTLGELPAGPRSLLVALHGIGNPGNLGTIIRTANAAGAGGVVLVGQTTDPFDPVAVKASMGALFGLPVVQVREAGELFGWAAGRGVTVITTSARATVSFWAASYPRPLALLLGAEGAGLPGEVLAQGDACVRIPMVGTAESLNLAVAAGLLLYEAQREGGLEPA
ncbi:MAG TPA: RNA methyltransferase [Streptosporangiaceae bacterium]|nr:RNA methyltransferase [Streptosporangiaceae bacterium]